MPSLEMKQELYSVMCINTICYVLYFNSNVCVFKRHTNASLSGFCYLCFLQIALVCDPLSYVSKDPFPGPLEEREFWATRLKALSSVREQLSSLLAMTILTNLEEAHSSYAGVFGQVYKDVDMVGYPCNSQCHKTTSVS